MASKISDSDDVIADINIVPFVDIILVVLIIFMVTAPIIQQQAIDIQLSNSTSAKKIPPSRVSIGIMQDGRVVFNGKISSTDELADQVASLLESEPNSQAVIAADKNVSHGIVVSVIDAVKAGGIDNFAISVGGR